MDIKQRYQGFQTLCGVLKDEGCHFLVLCSIAEEYLQKPVDLIGTIRISQSKGWMRSDFYVKDSIAILEYVTNAKWTRNEVAKLLVIRDNDYTEAVYYNARTGFRHYRRRGYDTLEHSVTVAEGVIEKYYIYTVGSNDTSSSK